MFFKRRKKKEGTAEQRTGFADLRRFYRRVPSRKHALGVTLHGDSHPPIPAELADLSAGGARIGFAADSDPRFHEDFEARLRITSLVHEGRVESPARLVRREVEQDGRVYYAFAFTDLSQLFSQLDPFYAKFLNRRRVNRVRPVLGSRIAVQVSGIDGGASTALQDVSIHGVGLNVSGDELAALVEEERVKLEFAVPGQERSFACHATRAHATERGSSWLLGYGFEEPEEEPGIDALQRYVQSREDEIRQWESAS